MAPRGTVRKHLARQTNDNKPAHYLGSSGNARTKINCRHRLERHPIRTITQHSCCEFHLGFLRLDFYPVYSKYLT